MKKLLVFLIVVFLSTDIYAGWNTDTRSRCRSWRKKYVARAIVFTGLIGFQRTASCGDAYAEKIKNCAWQKTFNGPSGVWQNGGVRNNFCSRDETINKFEHFLLPNTNTTKDIEETNFRSKDVQFDEINREIIIDGISGFIKLQKGNGYNSNIRIALWKPSDDFVNEVEDEKMDINEVLSQFEIRLTHRGVFFNGELVSDELKEKFIINDSNNEYDVSFNNLKFVIPVPEGISMDDLAIRIEGDGAPNTKDNLVNSIENTNQSLLNNNFTDCPFVVIIL
jgi:hypothetical protein